MLSLVYWSIRDDPPNNCSAVTLRTFSVQDESVTRRVVQSTGVTGGGEVAVFPHGQRFY